MVNKQIISGIEPVFQLAVLTVSDRLTFPPVGHGFFSYSFPSLILSKQTQEGGIRQFNLSSVSAGNDLRMSTMRPNPYLSAGIEARRDYRGLLQFNSRSI